MRDIDRALSVAITVGKAREREALRATEQHRAVVRKLTAELTELEGFAREYASPAATMTENTSTLDNRLRFALRVARTASTERQRLVRLEREAEAARGVWEECAKHVRRLEHVLALRHERAAHARNQAEQRACDQAALSVWHRPNGSS